MKKICIFSILILLSFSCNKQNISGVFYSVNNNEAIVKELRISYGLVKISRIETSLDELIINNFFRNPLGCLDLSLYSYKKEYNRLILGKDIDSSLELYLGASDVTNKPQRIIIKILNDKTLECTNYPYRGIYRKILFDEQTIISNNYQLNLYQNRASVGDFRYCNFAFNITKNLYQSISYKDDYLSDYKNFNHPNQSSDFSKGLKYDDLINIVAFTNLTNFENGYKKLSSQFKIDGLRLIYPLNSEKTIKNYDIYTIYMMQTNIISEWPCAIENENLIGYLFICKNGKVIDYYADCPIQLSIIYFSNLQTCDFAIGFMGHDLFPYSIITSYKGKLHRVGYNFSAGYTAGTYKSHPQFIDLDNDSKEELIQTDVKGKIETIFKWNTNSYKYYELSKKELNRLAASVRLNDCPGQE